MTYFVKTVIKCRHPVLKAGHLYSTKHLVGQYKNQTSWRFFPEDRSLGSLYVKAQYGEPDLGLLDMGNAKDLRSTHPISNMSHVIAIKPADKWVFKGGNLRIPVRCPHDSNKWTVSFPLEKWYGFFPFEIFRDKYHGCSFHDCIESYYRCDHGRKAYKANVKV